jgi:hypothetical protein
MKPARKRRRHAARPQPGLDRAATGVALLGALVVVGVMSAPLAMEEIERFRGVRLVLALPPLIALGLYLFDRRFGSGVERPRTSFSRRFSPISCWRASRSSPPAR